MRRLLAAWLLMLMLPVYASALKVNTEHVLEGGSQLFLFRTENEMPQSAPGKQAAIDPVQMAIDMQIAVRFEQEKAQTAAGRSHVLQDGTLYQDGKIASMARTWQGEQADGREGSSAAALTVSLETGMEIYLDELFADYEGALAEMERIITDDVLDSMSDYMEYADLLPMPADCYAITGHGLTIYWPEDRYRYFDGEAGSVTFLWHELADYIGEDSPVYALAHPDTPYSRSDIEKLCFDGSPDPYLQIELGDLLIDVAERYPLADPDYTSDALVYPLERMRGFAVEIPKYAETEENDTPISAIRASRISFGNLLTTGKTMEEEVLALLGNPVMEKVFDEDAAFDAMLETGRSLYYEIEGNVLQAHFDENSVLSCLILRDALPESLY